MQSPYGLGIDASTLFVCDAYAGLKIFDATDPLNIQLITQIDGYQTYDVIPYNNILIVIGPEGLFQYDYSNMPEITFLSSIPIT